MPTVPIAISAERLARYCEETRRRARGPARTLAELTAVETFLSAMAGPEEKAGEAYREATALLRRHMEACRDELLDDNAAALVGAMEKQAPESVTAVHTTLSRNGFQQAMARAADRLSPEQLDRSWVWARSWCAEAERCAAEASGYPDAYDFLAAGIRIETHAAMKDLVIFLGERVT